MGCSSSKHDETQELAPQRITGLENNNDSTPPVRNTVGLGAQSQKSPGTSGPTSIPRNPSWHPPPAQIGIDVLHDDNNADIDIVAVQGLASNPDYAWIWQPQYNKTGQEGYPVDYFNWLKDLLPGGLTSSKISSRVMAFNYLSGYKSNAPQQKLSSLSGLLLDSLAIPRKNAIISATQESSPHLDIGASTAGIIFLGTPHYGCKVAQWSNIILALYSPFQTIERRIVTSLATEADELDDRLHEFTRWINHQGVPVVCFYETTKTDYSKLPGALKKLGEVLVVPQQSACITGLDHTKLDTDHSKMNKYFGEKDPSYRQVFGRIDQMALGARDLLSRRQTPVPIPKLQDLHKGDLYTCLQQMRVTDPRDILSDIKEKEFCDWQASDTSQFLRIAGPPGMGKTMMSTLIVEDIKNSVEISPDRAFVYFFCDDKAGEDRRMPAAILRSLIWQLLLQNNNLFRHLEEDIERHGLNSLFTGLFQDLAAMWRIFKSMVRDKQAGEVFILIDAFDECDSESRKELLARIPELFSASSGGPLGKVKLLVTSRLAIHDIESGFRPLGVTIELHSERIKKDLEEFIELKTQDLTMRNPGLRPSESQIRQDLKAGSEGTFLWVSLMVAEIQRSGVLNHKVKKLLKSPLRQLDEIYESILNQISPEKRSEAQFILHCMVAAKRPLTKMEMKIAYVTSELPVKNTRSEPVPRQKDVKDYDDILLACSSILTPMHEDKGDSETVSFCHQSVKDFLLKGSRTNREWYFTSTDKANLLVFQTCWKYLTAEDGLLGECLRGTSKQPGLKYVPGWDGKKLPTNHRFKKWTKRARTKSSEYVLLEYVYEMWDKHAISTYPAVKKDLEIDFNDALWLRDVWFLCAAKDGEVDMLNFLLTFDKDLMRKIDQSERTALSLAAGNDHVRAVERLLAAREVEIDAKDSIGRTPLSYAAEKGHVEVIKTLLATGKADIESKALFATRPLHWAAEAGHVDAVKKLLDMGAEVDAIDSIGRTPLSRTTDIHVYDLLRKRGAAEIEQRPKRRGSNSSSLYMPEFEPLF
ncbi:uncharacterized protein MYU51_004997 [Penicillium brevicompactum]